MSFAGSLLLYALFPTARSPLCSSLCAAFKESDWGSRPMGMGRAFRSVADDVNALMYNPAGLAQLEKVETHFTYARLFSGLDKVDLGLSYFAAALPLRDQGTLGFSWANFSSKDSYQEDTFSLAYSRWIFGDTALGLNAKYLGHRYETDERTRLDPVFENGYARYAFTFDAGLYSIFGFSSSENTIAFGMAAKNITQPDVGLKTEDKVPLEIGVGVSYNTPTWILPALDVSYRFQEWGNDEDKLSFNLGVETWVFEHLLGLRAGAGIGALSMGFGVRPLIADSFLQFDYAFLWPLEVRQTQGSHHLSLTFRFSSSQSAHESNDAP